MNDEQRRMALEMITAFEKLGHPEAPDMREGAPRPEPELRGIPRV